MISRPNRILAIVVGLIAVVAVVTGVLSATRTVTEYDRGTPEGAVQAYLSAVIDADNPEAVEFLGDESPCTVVDLDQAYLPDGVRVVLRDTEVDGDSARVEVDVMTSGGPFGGSEFTESVTFSLNRAGGHWLITGTPWPMYMCNKEG